MTKRMRPLRWAAAALLVGVMAAPMSVDARDIEAGAVAGGNWSLLTAPDDPLGSHTFLWGSAFDGYGALAGVSASAELTYTDWGAGWVTADLLYGYHRGAGWADYTEGGRVDVLLTTHVLRFPVLARLGLSRDASSPSIGVGLEPIVGLRSGAVVETTGIDQAVAPVETTPTASVAAVMAAGFDWRRDGFVIPMDVRLVWNPTVASGSEERFDGFNSRDEPGDYRVTFDWQVMATAGIRWGL